MSKLGTYIRGKREARGWSISDLARAAGVGISTIHNIENNPAPVTPKRATLGKIARALEVSSREILAYADYQIDESDGDDQRAARLAVLIQGLPRLREIAEKIAQLPPSEQDVALSLLEAHLAMRQQRKASNRHPRQSTPGSQ